MIVQTIKEIIAGRGVHEVAPTATLSEASMKLTDANIGALAVMSEGALVGILSERDIIRKAVAEGLAVKETTVFQVMTPDPVTLPATSSLADALEAMVIGGFRHLPITENGTVVGMLSMRDIPTEYRLMFERFNEYLTSQPLDAQVA